jgi:hypothetical protein
MIHLCLSSRDGARELHVLVRSRPRSWNTCPCRPNRFHSLTYEVVVRCATEPWRDETWRKYAEAMAAYGFGTAHWGEMFRAGRFCFAFPSRQRPTGSGTIWEAAHLIKLFGVGAALQPPPRGDAAAAQGAFLTGSSQGRTRYKNVLLTVELQIS